MRNNHHAKREYKRKRSRRLASFVENFFDTVVLDEIPIGLAGELRLSRSCRVVSGVQQRPYVTRLAGGAKRAAALILSQLDSATHAIGRCEPTSRFRDGTGLELKWNFAAHEGQGL